MPHPALRKARLPVLGAMLLLALAAEDLRRSFTLLHPGTLLLCLLLAAGLSIGVVWRLGRTREISPADLASLIFAAAAAALALNAVTLHARAGAEPERLEAREWDGLRERARRLQDEFSELLSATGAPIERARELARRNPRSGGPRNAARAYETLDLIAAGESVSTSGTGISLYGADGHALAWSGPVRILPRELIVLSIPRETTKWLIVEDAGLSRLVGLARPWRDQRLLMVVETLLRSAYDPRVLDGRFSGSAFEAGRDRVSFLSFRRPAVELEDLFERFGEAMPLPSDDLLAANVALRAPGGGLLAYATLKGRGTGEIVEGITRPHDRAGRLIVVIAGSLLVGALLLPRRAPTISEIRRQGTRIAAVWGLRALLLVFPLPAGAVRPALDDAALFSRAGFGGLLRSPLDFLLTGAAVLATGVLVSLVVSRGRGLASWWSGRAYTPLALALAVAFLLGTRLPEEALRIVENTRIDILTVIPTRPEPARLALQSACAFVLMGFVIPLVALLWASFWALASRRDGGPPPPPDPTDRTLRWLALLILPCAVLSSFILELALQPAATTHLRSFLEGDLGATVQYITVHRKLDLRDALSQVSEFPGLAERLEAVPPEGDPTLAHDLWKATTLAGRGYAGSITVSDAGGEPVSRFSRSYPAILDSRTLEPSEIPENTVFNITSVLRGRRVPGLHAHTFVRRRGETVGSVTIHLRNDFGDLPGLSPPTLLLEAADEVGRPTSLLPAWNPQLGFAVYSPQGLPLLANPREPPPPPPDAIRERLLADFQEKHWQERDEGGTTWHDLFFGSNGQVVALSFPEPGPAGRLARAIRLSVQSILALVILVTPWAVASSLRLGWRPSPARLVEALTRTHYRRLFASFLVAALAPLTVLALALANFVRGEIVQDVTEHGWTVLGSMRGQVEDFWRVQELGGIPDDAYLFSLTEETSEELSLYTEGILRAASDREIYDLGLLPERLDGEVNRRIELEGRRVVQDRVEINGVAYHRILGVVALGPPHEGVLSIILSAVNPEVARRARQIYDVMLIAYASVILFMGLVAYVLARRIARPIRHLSQAAARIATGDLRAEVLATARDETGDLIEAFNAMARAIRRQHEDLEERGNYIEKILLNATTGVLSVDLRGRIVTLNPAAIAILGMEGLAPGVDLMERLSTREDCRPLAAALDAGLRSPSRSGEVEAVVGTVETGVRNVRVRIAPFTEGAGLLVFLDDVTETVRSNRLATWAEMARRIAHEIKNPLTPIKLSADHIRRVYRDGSADFPRVLDECLRTVDEQIQSLRTIAQQFSIYARHPEIRKEPTDVRRFLETVLRPYSTAPPPGVSIECRFDGVRDTVAIDPAILSQALVNIVENALQAMPEGGRLEIRSETATIGEGKRVLNLIVSDTGVGMSREALARVFEPYFSTKGSGTGLGMAIARRAVEEHQGSIKMESAPGRGTTATITLPLD